MLRTPDIPERPKKEFNEEEYQKELAWLKRKRDGKIVGTNTRAHRLMPIGTSLLLAFIFGGFIGAFAAIFIPSYFVLFSPMVIVFLLANYFIDGKFARVEIDVERGLLLYEGTMTLGGEYRSTRYRGPYQVVDSTILVKFREVFGFMSQPYIRFVTSSGYMRLNFKPETDRDFLVALEQLGLVNIDLMTAALDKEPVRVEDDYVVYFQKNFDRQAFKAELKRKRENEEREKEVERRIKRKQLIEQSSKKSEKTQNKGADRDGLEEA